MGSDKTIRFVFYPRESTSLGHTSRLLGVADAVRRLAPEVSVLFLVDDGDTRLIEAHGYAWSRIPADRASLETWWAKTVRSAGTQMVLVQDSSVHHVLSGLARDEQAHQVLILRERTDLLHFLYQKREEITGTDLVVFPHSKQEIGLLPLSWLPESKLMYCGALLRRSLEDIDVAGMRARYGIQTDELTIVVSNGGGNGDVNQDDDFIDTAFAAIRLASADLPEFHVICITGPSSRWQIEHVEFQTGRVTVRDFEPRLFDLFGAANLVIARGGYNTIHELVELGVPSLCLPAARPTESQQRRIEQAAAIPGSNIQPGQMDVSQLAASIRRLARMPRWTYQSDGRPDLIAANKRALAERLLQLARRAENEH